ncbi:MAG TPA: hypothetical protein VFN67_16050 [Polyangiales bacterium]|nr:hypothetical protein [Polyangiales bacterium]
MTHPTDSAVTLERLAQLLDAYGGDSARWPEHERTAALQLIAADPRAQVLHRAALELDGALDISVMPEVASSALRARVLEIPIKHPAAAPSGWGWNWNWKLALFALTPCVIGFLSGTLLMEPNVDPDDEAWDELAQVVMPAQLSDDLYMLDEESP